MKIEILFPEYCNLYGDFGNTLYLKACLPGAEFIETPLTGKPRFLGEKVDLVYMGPMSEQKQEKILGVLRPLKKEIAAQIESGTVFLCTGNAWELFGERIENEDGSRIEALGILPAAAKRDFSARHNSVFLGDFEGEPVVGFKSQFSMGKTTGGVPGLFKVEKGVGLGRDADFEGIRYKNFFGTYLIGPLLPLNPPFTRKLLSLIGAEDPTPAFEPQVEAAYRQRLKELQAEGFVAERPPEGNQLPIHLPRFGKK